MTQLLPSTGAAGPAPHAWWRDAAVYQVYVRSFADADGDGVGDLPGITARLPYLVALGVDALWLTPFYRSPMADHGYDVTDQCDVDPLFGSLADADALLARAHELGLRVIVDLVPNHSSSEHPWFRQALADPGSSMRERYLFRPAAADGGPPNNWRSVFGGPAWTREPAGHAYYLHLFDTGQPDFDWRNPAVVREWDRILRFWLDRGVDGFRIDVAHGLFKQADLAGHDDDGPLDPLFQSVAMPHAWDQPEVVEVYRRWRALVEDYPDRMMVGEVFLPTIEQVDRYVGPDRLHQSFNFPLLAAPLSAATWRGLIEQSLAAFETDGSSPTWVLSNHDVVRHATRYGGGEQGRSRARAATLTLLALPGSVYVYQGEELGLEQDELPDSARQDPIWVRSGGTVQGRDGCRTPLPWTGERAGNGFTSGRPWLPFGPQADERNVQAQEQDGGSTLTFYRQALALRRDLRDHLARQVCWRTAPPDCLLLERTDERGGALLCALNTGDSDAELELPSGPRPLLTSGDGVQVDGGTVRLPAGTAAWWHQHQSS